VILASTAPARLARPAVAPALSAGGLAFAYQGRPVLTDVSFEVMPGEVFGFLGRNGAGKSTLFSILAGLLRPAAGRLFAGGKMVDARDRGLRARTGVVFQSPSLDPKLTCRENLLLAAALFRVPRRQARERSARLLAEAGLGERAGEAAGKLSGGLKRRLELARALVHRPSLLILDEPTTGLDAAAFARTWETVEALRRQEGLTVLLTTHRPEEAERCDRLAVLAHGRVVACETPHELVSRVAGDVLEVEATDPAGLAAEVASRLGLRSRVTARGVTIEAERGHELVPRLVEAFPAGRLRSVAVRRPTLADAFVDITGASLAEDEA
jgi:ABC-2 type transport system ATP-binding protein